MWLTAQAISSNPWIPHCPTIKQLEFLAAPEREKFYGGAAGGGKSDALLMNHLLYADVKGYSGLILRRTFADLSLPGAIMDRAKEWLAGTDAHWNERDKTYTFPSGATLTFGYLEHENDKYRYQGAEFQKISFDELTQFTEEQYKYLRTRVRRLEGSMIPPSMDSASNPGGMGHEWVYEHFVIGEHPDRIFVPATLEDNPHLDATEYELSLAELDDTTKAQLRHGLWVTDPRGKPYKREWWRGRNRYDSTDPGYQNACVARLISVDTAMKDKDESDYTAICVFELSQDWRLYLRHVHMERLEFPELTPVIEHYAYRYNRDSKLREIVIEDKAHGTAAIQTLRAAASNEIAPRLVEFNPGPNKLQRARQAAVWAKRGCVVLPQPSASVPWLTDFERQVFNFPDTTHDDMVDAFSQGIIFYEHYAAEGWRARGRQGEAA